MLVQLLGVMDLLAGVLLILSRFGFEGQVMFYVGIIVLIKSLVFFGDIVGLLDIAGAIFLIAIAVYSIEPYGFIVGIFSLWFLQKGFFSFVT
ncbi:MAG: hypothetical protein Q8Q42_04495 [Nanoarchaeota archaeon]|nr:hypothetical protein [Nanoarchaeota archaeon]